jgi:hypothetical protein
MKQVLALLLLAVVAATAHVAEAKRFIASRRECRDACGGPLVICQALRFRSAQAGAACRSAVIRICRRNGVAVCDLSSSDETTTTTTSTTTSTTFYPWWLR